MTKNEVSEEQLVLDLANLRLEVADKEQQLAELRYNRISNSGSSVTASTSFAADSRQASSSSHSIPDTPPSSSFPSRQTLRRSTEASLSPPSRHRASTSSFWRSNGRGAILTGETVPESTPLDGYKDCDRVQLYLGDIVVLRTSSTGRLAPFFQSGDRVKIIGLTADHLLLLESLIDSNRITRRASFNVRKILIAN